MKEKEKKIKKKSIFDLKEYFSKISIISIQEGNKEITLSSYTKEDEEKKIFIDINENKLVNNSNFFICRTCNKKFEEFFIYQQHYKSEWHRFLYQLE